MGLGGAEGVGDEAHVQAMRVQDRNARSPGAADHISRAPAARECQDKLRPCLDKHLDIPQGASRPAVRLPVRRETPAGDAPRNRPIVRQSIRTTRGPLDDNGNRISPVDQIQGPIDAVPIGIVPAAADEEAHGKFLKKFAKIFRRNFLRLGGGE